MVIPSLHKVVDRIYDAALEPARWPQVAQFLQRTFNSPVAVTVPLDASHRECGNEGT